MSRPKSLNPKYCHHKSSGRAFVVIDGQFNYLGKYNTQESRDAYARIMGEWIARNRITIPKSKPDEPASGITVSTLIAAFWRHAQSYYIDPAGKPSLELENFRLALRPLRRLYGSTPAGEFGPLALKSIRAAMIKPQTETDAAGKSITRPGWSRNYANRQTARIKQVFKWAVGEQLIPASVHHGLTAVDALKRGRSEARETEPVHPVPVQYVEAVRPFLSRHLNAVIDLQMLCGARGGELLAMRTCDIDRSALIWTYKPAQHKTAHHGHERIIRFGKRAQAILAPLLKANLAAPIFSPADAEEERHEQDRQSRETPLTPSQIKRAERAKNRPRKRPPGERYSSRSYCRAIARACDAAFPPPAPIGKCEDETHRAWRSRLTTAQKRELRTWRADHRWHPHQLRHNFATTIRRDFGPDAALNLLGDKSTRMIDIYAEHDARAASDIMEKIG